MKMKGKLSSIGVWPLAIICYNDSYISTVVEFELKYIMPVGFGLWRIKNTSQVFRRSIYRIGQYFYEFGSECEKMITTFKDEEYVYPVRKYNLHLDLFRYFYEVRMLNVA